MTARLLNTCILLGLAALQLYGNTCRADVIKVATASNFRITMSTLAERFEQDTGHQLALIFGSTGKHYAQILHGAPFDAFFAADAERPELLERSGHTVPRSRFTYARGQLALFGPGGFDGRKGADLLSSAKFRRLAIANPDLAPYGRAARETLESLGLLEQVRHRLVMGENIGQAFQYVFSGNAELGFVAWSQLKSGRERWPGESWLVPAELHQPIDQQAVLLNDTPAARDFMLYMRSDVAIKVIREHGYLTP